MLATIAIAAIYLALPDRLTAGPRWILPATLCLLLIPSIAAHRARNHRVNALLGLAINSVVMVALLWALTMLISRLPTKQDPPEELLRSAAALWASNILVFASWYWRLDAGGPNERDLRLAHTEGAFLFPQMTMGVAGEPEEPGWKPGFVDYLFLAFNTSTAFSPTDVPVLSRWAKVLMMVQSIISLATIAILAARAINIL